MAQISHNVLNTQLSKLMLHLNWNQKEQGSCEEALLGDSCSDDFNNT